jgi:hypothetical protein
MAEPHNIAFDAPAFLAEAGLGRRIIQLKSKQAFFSQGGPADSIFYLQSGRAKLTVFSENGKEATITLFAVGDFVGEESLASIGGLRLAHRFVVVRCAHVRGIICDCVGAPTPSQPSPGLLVPERIDLPQPAIHMLCHYSHCTAFCHAAHKHLMPVGTRRCSSRSTSSIQNLFTLRNARNFLMTPHT